MSQVVKQSRPIAKVVAYLAVGIAIVGLVGCGGGGLTQSQKSGFLTSAEYNRLEEVPIDQPGVKLYRYVTPGFDKSSVKGVMIDPVVLYQIALKGSGQKGLTDETIYQTRMIIDKELKDRASKRFNVVSQPSAGIGRLSVAITGAVVEGDSFEL